MARTTCGESMFGDKSKNCYKHELIMCIFPSALNAMAAQ